MARGPKKHLKRIAAPSHWMLDKMTGIYAPRPSTGPHKLRECIPLTVLLRNRLKYALTYSEVKMIVMQRAIKVDGKVRTDQTFPAGIMDVITIDKTKENFRILYDVKGRFVPHKIGEQEASYKLCRVKKILTGAKGVPYAVTHDARTIRYIHPEIKANDTVRVDLKTGKILDFLKFVPGQLVMITGGHNIGRVGTIVNIEKHPGSVSIVHLKDALNHTYSTRLLNVFVIGQEAKSWISLPRGEGLRKSLIEDRQERLKRFAA